MWTTKLNASGRKLRSDLLDESVPDPILAEIFDYLTAQELVTVSYVSKRWNHISRSPSLWTGLRGTQLFATLLTFTGKYRENRIKVHKLEKRKLQIDQIIM